MEHTSAAYIATRNAQSLCDELISWVIITGLTRKILVDSSSRFISRCGRWPQKREEVQIYLVRISTVL